jgi:hypothetical protein
VVTTTAPAPAAPGVRAAAAHVARTAALLSPLFLLPAALVVADRAGILQLDRRITFHTSLVANLLLYWLVAALLLAALRRPRAVAAFAANRWRPLVAAGMSAALALVAVEVLLRASGHPAGRPTYRWVPSPTLHHRNLRTDGAYHWQTLIRTNEDGFRSPHSRADFLRLARRIAVLGDSFVFGVGVDEADLATAELERELRRRLGTDDIGVLNTGATSYSPLLERTLFREVVRHYQPTLTLLVLDGNDIGDDVKYADLNRATKLGETLFDVPEDSAPFEPAVVRLLEPLLFQLSTPYLVLQRFVPSLRGEHDYYKFRVEVGGTVERDHWFILRHPLPETRPFMEKTLGYARDIAADAQAIGSQFVLVVNPRYFHWSDRECPDNWDSRISYDEPYEFAYLDFFDVEAPRAGLRLLSLLPAFRDSTEFPLVKRNDPHWNEAGHRVAGRAIADYLLSEKLLTP